MTSKRTIPGEGTVILRQWFGLDPVSIRRVDSVATAGFILRNALAIAMERNEYYLARVIDLEASTTQMLVQYGGDGCDDVVICSRDQYCRGCGCSEYDPCESDDNGGTCGWVEDDLCTTCTAEGTGSDQN
jgi:hypothetical protein